MTALTVGTVLEEVLGYTPDPSVDFAAVYAVVMGVPTPTQTVVSSVYTEVMGVASTITSHFRTIGGAVLKAKGADGVWREVRSLS